jgi:hypothetical protein
LWHDTAGVLEAVGASATVDITLSADFRIVSNKADALSRPWRVSSRITGIYAIEIGGDLANDTGGDG